MLRVRMPRRQVSRKPSEGGFTLIELVMTMAILGVLLALAAPAFTEALLSNKLSSFSNNFVASAQVARSEAIKRNATLTMCRSADSATCATSGGWQQGWIVMCNTDDAATCRVGGASVLVIYQQAAMPSGFQLTGDTYSLTFPGTGSGVTQANLVLCRSAPLGAQERTLKVTATGRASVATTKTGVCT